MNIFFVRKFLNKVSFIVFCLINSYFFCLPSKEVFLSDLSSEIDFFYGKNFGPVSGNEVLKFFVVKSFYKDQSVSSSADCNDKNQFSDWSFNFFESVNRLQVYLCLKNDLTAKFDCYLESLREKKKICVFYVDSHDREILFSYIKSNGCICTPYFKMKSGSGVCVEKLYDCCCSLSSKVLCEISADFCGSISLRLSEGTDFVWIYFDEKNSLKYIEI